MEDKRILTGQEPNEEYRAGCRFRDPTEKSGRRLMIKLICETRRCSFRMTREEWEEQQRRAREGK